jgi:hypothetical protein
MHWAVSPRENRITAVDPTLALTTAPGLSGRVSRRGDLPALSPRDALHGMDSREKCIFRPTHQFRRIWSGIVGRHPQPVENSIAVQANPIGPHKVMWATDYLH